MFRLSGRARKIPVAVLAVLVVAFAVGLAILQEIVRRVAVSQAPKLAGRVLSLDDVDLNLFTGHLTLKGGKVFKPGVKDGRLELKGTGTPVPVDVEMTIKLRNGRIEPFQAYFPIPARFAGSFNSDSTN